MVPCTRTKSSHVEKQIKNTPRAAKRNKERERKSRKTQRRKTRKQQQKTTNMTNYKENLKTLCSRGQQEKTFWKRKGNFKSIGRQLQAQERKRRKQ
jgi:hypothetical protein